MQNLTTRIEYEEGALITELTNVELYLGFEPQRSSSYFSYLILEYS